MDHTIILDGVLIRLSVSGRSVQVYSVQVLLLGLKMLDLVSSVGLVPMRLVTMRQIFLCQTYSNLYLLLTTFYFVELRDVILILL